MYCRTNRICIRNFFLLIIGLGLWIGQAVAFAQVHLVIDVSGNIQRLDPQKQRIAAIKSFINQLPDGTHAGIWTYAKGVNHLVSTGVVNAEWRRKATQAVNGISGYGTYSNVGDALAQATYYWRDNKMQKGRNVVLVTDSGLRVSDNPEENAAARKRVLGNLLPAMRQGGVRVYVLGFDKADASLYKELASATNGSYQSVAKPADLSAAFKVVSTQLALPPARAVKPEPVVAKETKPIEKPVETAPVEEPKVKEKITPVETTEPAPVVAVENIAEPAVETASPAEVAEAEVKAPEQYNQPPKPENVDIKITETPTSTEVVVDITPIPEQPAAPVQEAPNATTAVTTAPAETLGAQEAEEIRTALENAEAELSELLTEFAAMPKNENSITTSQVFNGQQSNEPLVITLADGSVLVTPNDHKAQELTTQTTASANAPSMPMHEVAIADNEETPEHTIPSEDRIEWPGTSDETDIWPVILTILVVVNLVLIFLLFIGRFLWLRHKRKNSDKPNNNMF